MRYKFGDKVRVRGDLEGGYKYGNANLFGGMVKYKNKIAEIIKLDGEWYILDLDIDYLWSPDMIRPADFKIWCNTEAERQAVLEELEKEGYEWHNRKEKPTEKDLLTPVGILVWRADLTYTKSIENFDKKKYCQFTPSEFTGIDFSEKIIITKTTTGATATYGDKMVTTEGEFEDASRQALAEVLCPFKVGDKVEIKINPKMIGTVKEIASDLMVNVQLETMDNWLHSTELEPYIEPLYNAKLFCIKSSRNGAFKSGHIYKVENGVFTDIKEFGSDKPYKDVDDINKRLTAQFMEVLDD